MRTPEQLTALLGSRICHDLISPLGAISNGVELLEMAGDASGPEIALISESIDNANARIRFFRVAFGLDSPSQMLGDGEIRSILNDMTRGGRLQIQWAPLGEHRRTEVKLAFLALLCLESAMPRGGTIEVQRDGEVWRLTGIAERFRIEEPLWLILDGRDGGEEVGAADVHFLLLPLQAQAAGRRLTAIRQETRIELRF